MINKSIHQSNEVCYVLGFAAVFFRSSRWHAAGFLLALLFYSEDGGSKFLENVGELLDHAALYPRGLNYS
jgi:hypothetical protein